LLSRGERGKKNRTGGGILPCDCRILEEREISLGRINAKQTVEAKRTRGKKKEKSPFYGNKKRTTTNWEPKRKGKKKPAWAPDGISGVTDH